MWAAIRDVVVTLAAATGAIVAGLGLTTWRRQLAGKNEYEIGLKFLRAAYRVRDAISIVRHPMMSPGELAAAAEQVRSPEEAKSVAGDEAFAQAAAAAYRARWRSIIDAMTELDVARVEAEVLWGEAAASSVASLRKCVGQLQWALEEHLRRGDRPTSLYEKVQEALFWTGDETPFSKEIREAVEAVESFVRPKLKA